MISFCVYRSAGAAIRVIWSLKKLAHVPVTLCEVHDVSAGSEGTHGDQLCKVL